MRSIIIFVTVILFICCGQSTVTNNSIEVITDTGKQDSLFNHLLTVTGHTIPGNIQNDSLAFLILPLQASCPACRKKTIDSIAAYSNRLLPNHFIILSVKGGKKLISSFFKEEEEELPVIPGRVFLDSMDIASTLDLYDKKPTMYYTHDKKTFVKVSSVPATVKEDLHRFFSGNHYSSL